LEFEKSPILKALPPNRADDSQRGENIGDKTELHPLPLQKV